MTMLFIILKAVGTLEEMSWMLVFLPITVGFFIDLSMGALKAASED